MPATIIAIAGPSGSGKSLLTEHLKHALSQHEATHSRSLAVVCEDAYYHSQAHLSLADRAALNFDHPDALDHDQLERDLLALRDGHPVNLPVYDYASHTRTSEPIALAAADIVLVEGCLLLSQERIREVVDFSVFVATDLETCLTRRIARDTVERGRTKDSVVEQFESSVRPMYHAFLAPSARYADLTVSGETATDVALRSIIERVLPLLRQTP